MSVRTKTKKDLQLAQLPEETWGWRMKRAREKYAHLTLDELVAILGQWTLIDKSTISRLEKLDEVPTNPRQRQTAYLCTLIYGLAPEQFGVGPDDVPPGWRESTAALQFARSGWLRGTALQSPFLGAPGLAANNLIPEPMPAAG